MGFRKATLTEQREDDRGLGFLDEFRERLFSVGQHDAVASHNDWSFGFVEQVGRQFDLPHVGFHRRLIPASVFVLDWRVLRSLEKDVLRDVNQHRSGPT